MRGRALLLAAFVTAGSMLTSGAGAPRQQPGGQPPARKPIVSVKADIVGKGIKGTVTMREVDAFSSNATDPKYLHGTKMVEFTASVEGLTQGAHGIHLHAVGKCDGPTFASAGGHFDPGPHGSTDEDTNHPYHMGDLANIVADAKGHAAMITATSRIIIDEGLLTILDADGTAVVIHANPDKGVPGAPKSGVSGGPRIACGVVVPQ
jgi:Cu-Zn family superoxide dismutase